MSKKPMSDDDKAAALFGGLVCLAIVAWFVVVTFFGPAFVAFLDRILPRE